MNPQQKEDGPEISPSVVFLYDLLKWVRQGRIRVPAFQRSFVWKRQNMLDLFDSVRWKYPIGTLLFWRSSVETAHPHDRFGPFDLSNTKPAERLLLLDGQQRLTTLAGVLLHGESGMKLLEDDEDSERWAIYFDAIAGENDGEFLHMPTEETPKVWQVPLHQLSDANGLFTAIGNIFRSDEIVLKEAGCSKEILSERLQAIARTLQSYRIPIVEFVTDDLNLVVESFTRLNRKGISIGADEMFSALTYQAGEAGGRFHVAREIDCTLAEIKAIGFGEVERRLVLRAFLIAAGEDPYRTNWQKLGDEKRKEIAEKLPEAMKKARSGLLRGIEFLQEENIYNARMLPYTLQLVGLSAWLGEDPNPSPAAKRLLRRWLWLTGFASWFGQGNPSRYTAVLTELREKAQKVHEKGVPVELERLPWSTPAEPFPERYDLRSARVRTLLCLLAKDGVTCLDNSKKNAQTIAEDILRNGPEAMRIIWSVTKAKSSLSSSPANRMFDVFGKERGQARTLLRKHGISFEFLASHMLPSSINDALQNTDSMQDALQYRLDKMIERERAFMSELELTLPSARTGSTTIDQDDDAPLPDEED